MQLPRETDQTRDVPPHLIAVERTGAQGLQDEAVIALRAGHENIVARGGDLFGVGDVVQCCKVISRD